MTQASITSNKKANLEKGAKVDSSRSSLTRSYNRSPNGLVKYQA